MEVIAKQHAKNRPPSSAARWLPCPGSATVAPLYPSAPSEASLKGDLAHSLLENGILFGIRPNTDDPDMDLNICDVLDWVSARRAEYGADTQVYAEQEYDIPETGEFGTCDITFVTSNVIHIADYKNGYVYTDAVEQMMTYLLGAIAKFGERTVYRITVIQPNFDHCDGPFRTINVSHTEVLLFRQQVIDACQSQEFVAGDWCKKTYCPHRGACATFKAWAEKEGVDAYYPSEVNAIDEQALATALDHADTLHGYRDELRKEAMRRIAQHNRIVPGYKLVKSRQQRDFAGEDGRKACYEALIAAGYSKDDLYDTKEIAAGGFKLIERTALSVAGVERMVKQKYKTFGRGKWKQAWDEHFAPHIRSFSGSLTLVRAIDGRPAHYRGSEFGTLAPQDGNKVL